MVGVSTGTLDSLTADTLSRRNHCILNSFVVADPQLVLLVLFSARQPAIQTSLVMRQAGVHAYQ